VLALFQLFLEAMNFLVWIQTFEIFIKLPGKWWTVFKPQLGDVITLSADALGAGSGAASAYAVVTSGTYNLLGLVRLFLV